MWEFLELLSGLAEIVVGIFDFVSWIKGGPNRQLRREAKRSGEPVPKRDRWNRLVWILTRMALK